MTRVIKAQRRGPQHLPAALVDARQQARAMLERARGQAEAVRRLAHERGFVEGREAGRAELAAQLLAHAVEHARALDALEPQVVQLAITAARTLVGEHLRADPDAVRALVAGLLQRLRHAGQARVHVHPDDVAAAEQACAELATGRESPAVVIEATADLARGDCVVDSDVGTLDARLQTRIDALARALERR